MSKIEDQGRADPVRLRELGVPHATVVGQKPAITYKVGDHVAFHHAGQLRKGIIRRFMWQDWADEPVAVIDIEGMSGPVGGSLGIRIEQRRIMGKV